MEKHPWDFKNEDEYRKYLYELKDAVNTLTKLTYFKSDLEHLRSENSTLRKWGVEMSERCQELEKDIDRYEARAQDDNDEILDMNRLCKINADRIKNLEKENDNLSAEINSLKDEISDLNKKLENTQMENGNLSAYSSYLESDIEILKLLK